MMVDFQKSKFQSFIVSRRNHTTQELSPIRKQFLLKGNFAV
jgi:hypothetical protein